GRGVFNWPGRDSGTMAARHLVDALTLAVFEPQKHSTRTVVRHHGGRRPGRSLAPYPLGRLAAPNGEHTVPSTGRRRNEKNRIRLAADARTDRRGPAFLRLAIRG